MTYIELYLSTGKPGIAGKDGLHGSHGTCIYCTEHQNDTKSSNLWLAPQIPSNKLKVLRRIDFKIVFSLVSFNSKKSRTIVVNEKDNLRLQCVATGNPKPHIEWTRKDGNVIDWGTWKDVSKGGHSINFTSINRVHIGTYVCVADNGIPPAVTHNFNVEVHCKLRQEANDKIF